MRALTEDEIALLNAMGTPIEKGSENADTGEFAFAYWSPELDAKLKNRDWLARERMLVELKKLGLVASEGRGKHAWWWITKEGIEARTAAVQKT